MELIGQALRLSASDLAGHLACRTLTALNLAVARGLLEAPTAWDPSAEALRQRGLRHEEAYLAHLRDQGYDVTVVPGRGVDAEAVAATVAAMRRGAPIIAQAALLSGGKAGRADVLRITEQPSQLGPWSYEVIDTKLARETRGGTVLQLCLYTDLVSDVQGTRADVAHVVPPAGGFVPETFRIDDFASYFRYVLRSLTRAVELPGLEAPYPDPKAHCEICRWRQSCNARRRADDHLSLVAGIRTLQIGELTHRGIGTMAALAVEPLPLAWRPERGTISVYERVREQARIQVESRAAGMVQFEPLPIREGFGLAQLPAPSAGDIFLDFEGDPFVGESGLEYLFGYAYREANGAIAHAADWALTQEAEKTAFQRFIDFATARLAAFPDLHIYHYAPYEPGALKRLMGRHATRADELDLLLRGRRFVDLFGLTRHAIRAGVESYSLKRLEPLYAFRRAADLPDANLALSRVAVSLELGDGDGIDAADRETVTRYNRDDCLSAWQLRDWLEARRDERVAAGEAIPRPEPESGVASAAVTERQARVDALADRLMSDVPVDKAERTPDQHGRWLLAQTLDWHRREHKAVWWEYFRLKALSEEDLLEERSGLSGLAFERANGGTAVAPIHRYRFPPQETALRGEEPLHNQGGDKLGSVAEISPEEGWIDIKKRKDSASVHPQAVFAHKVVGADVMADALLRLATDVAEHGLSGGASYRAACDLLLKTQPDLAGQPLRLPDETAFDAALRIAPVMTGGVLPIQGPPGAGKTHTAARMIAAMVRAGRRVGVTANSHKVIRNLLDAIVAAGREAGEEITCLQKVNEPADDTGCLRFTTDNAALFAGLAGDCPVAAGTAWLWARPEAAGAVDVLVVDEAAQMTLANVLAIAQAATCLVLLGDPQQLDQPMQGSHPEGTDVSALTHLLAGRKTVGAEDGLFLEETWRLHPSICAFTSSLFYEGRLRPRAGLDRQQIRSSGRLRGVGLAYLPVAHDGNQNAAPEEADAIAELFEETLAARATWIDRHGAEQPIQLTDILVIAPYNAQVFELQERLPPGARVGTVDKFQGQEAPIVIYSLTTSTPAEAPRGMAFLYSANRLNVATSRAKCLCVLVANPALFEVDCATPGQMKLANAFSAYLEAATPIID